MQRADGRSYAGADQKWSPVIAQATVETLRGGTIKRNYFPDTRPDARELCRSPLAETSYDPLYWGFTNSLVHCGGASGCEMSRIERQHPN